MAPHRTKPKKSRTVLHVAAWVGAGVAAFLAWQTSRPAPGVERAPAADPAAQLSLAEANARAVALVEGGLSYESLPYYRRQFALLDAPPWPAHKDFASALHNASIQSGPWGPATRSSFERIELLRESLHHSTRAEQITGEPSARAIVLDDRAHTLGFWGFPWDAERDLGAAARANPADAAIARRHLQLRAMMVHPTDLRLQAGWLSGAGR